MSEQKGSVVFAFQIPPEGRCIELEQHELNGPFEHPVWIHLDANDPGSIELAKQVATDIDDASLSALFDREARPRTLQVGGNGLISLRGVNLNENADAEDMVAIRMWVTPDRLISVRYRQLKTVLDIGARTRAGKGPRSTGDIVTAICGRLLERMEPVLTELDDDTDAIEERVIDEPNAELRQDITEIRKSAILFRRYIAPQKEAIGTLRTADFSWLSLQHRRQLQESLDRVTRYVEDLDAIRERAQIVKDELASMLSDKLNRNLYVLSVVTAIFLPLGALTGLFGINIGGMPGVENPNAFAIFSGSLITLVVGQIAYFKIKSWF